MQETVSFSLYECPEHGPEAGVDVIVDGVPVWGAPLHRDQLVQMRDDLAQMVTEYDASAERHAAKQN